MNNFLDGQLEPNLYERFVGKYVLVNDGKQSLPGLVRAVNLSEAVLVIDKVPVQDIGQQKVVSTDGVVFPVGGATLYEITPDYYQAYVNETNLLFDNIGKWVLIGDEHAGVVRRQLNFSTVLQPAIKKLPFVGYVEIDGELLVTRDSKIRTVPVSESYVRQLISDSKRDIEIQGLERKLKLESMERYAQRSAKKRTKKK